VVERMTEMTGFFRSSLLLFPLLLAGCAETAIDCGNEDTTSQCKKIIEDCSQYDAGIAPDIHLSKALGALHFACLNQNKFSPKCDHCKAK
jgi:hypothetical protein